MAGIRFTREALDVRWYVVVNDLVNDLVGGWAVSHVNKPLSEQDYRLGEGELFDAASEELARYVVEAHNARLEAL